MVKTKFRPLLILICFFFSFTLTTLACGNESLTTSTQVNTFSTNSVPSVTGSTSINATLTASLLTKTPLTETIKTEPTVAPSNTNSLQTNWLKGVPCRAPCWENITAGKTTPNEAIEILKNNPEFQVAEYSYYKPNHQLIGTIGDRGQAAVIWGFLSFHAEPTPPHIEIIKPITQPYKLKDIISLYGEPSHVIAVKAFQEGTQPQTYNHYVCTFK